MSEFKAKAFNFCISQAVNPVNTKTPIIDIQNDKPELPIKKLAIEAMKIPINAMYNKLPIFDKSTEVVYPNIAIAANAPPATKKVETKLPKS